MQTQYVLFKHLAQLLYVERVSREHLRKQEKPLFKEVPEFHFIVSTDGLESTLQMNSLHHKVLHSIRGAITRIKWNV